MEKSIVTTGNAQGFFKMVMHPLKFRLFLLKFLPSAYFSGVRLEEINEEKAVVTVPYKWFSTNPFRSTYFACLAMAAEMSTGVLAMAHLHQLQPKVSLLITGIQGNFLKKATGLTSFTCSNGLALRDAISKAYTSGEPQTVQATSIGVNKAGEKVAEFILTWSFKRK